MWDYYYKVRLYEFTNFSSRDIYEMWWIEQLKPYGNKAGRYYPFVKPSFDLNKRTGQIRRGMPSLKSST